MSFAEADGSAESVDIAAAVVQEELAVTDRGSEISLLLIETDDLSRDVFAREISVSFPYLAFDVADGLQAATTLMWEKHYDIVICDPFLREHETWKVISDICDQEPDSSLFVITSSSTVGMAAKGSCVKEVVCKPFELNEMMKRLESAINDVRKRKVDR